jgi:hypothetical protein
MVRAWPLEMSVMTHIYIAKGKLLQERIQVTEEKDQMPRA